MSIKRWILSAVLVAAGGLASAESVYRNADDIKGCLCGTVTGTVLDAIARGIQPDLKFRWFNEYAGLTEALLTDKIDIVIIDTSIARRWAASRPNDFEIAFCTGTNPYGYFFAKGSEWCEQINGELRKMIASGEVKRIIDKWCNSTNMDEVAAERVGDIPAKAGVIRFATTCEEEPGAFIRNGKPVGFDIDILTLVAARLGKRLEVTKTSHLSCIPSVQMRKAEVGGGCVTITKEREIIVDFSDCYYDDGFAVLVHRKKESGISSAKNLEGCHVAHLSSDFQRGKLEKVQPNLIFDVYTEYAFAFESLRKHKIDAISLGKTYADIWLAKYPGEFKISFDYAEDSCAYLFAKGSPWKAAFDAELSKLVAEGECERIIRKWCEAAKTGETPQLPEFPKRAADAKVVQVAAAALSEPWCFISRGEAIGVDIEILETIAARLGVRLKTNGYSWGGMLDAINGGKADIACGGIYTGGNTFPTVDVGIPYKQEKMCVLVRDEGVKVERTAFSIGSFLSALKASFVRTFITESRWKMMASGLGVTMLITLLATIFGTVLAFGVWMARTSRHNVVVSAAKAYIAILQGTPVLVLLMVLFYLVFGYVDINGIWVAIIGFSLNASAYLGETLRSGIDSVPRGQTEAALALGYSRRRAFFRFVLPQAARTILPVYRGEIVSILKATSIVGYIAINDLTKASDIVRSRTYESFFPILTTAFVYFAVAALLAWTLDRLGRRLDPANGRSK